MKKNINETIIKKMVAKTLKEYLNESIFGDEYYTFEDSDTEDGRLSDMNSETKEDSETRDSIESFFKQDGVDCADYAYKLYNVKSVVGKDTNDMKNARSKFSKRLNHRKNSEGYPYSFTSSELNRLKGMISANQLNEAINKALKNINK